jgi:hypothetical protein
MAAMKPIHKKILFFFALYLLFSVIVVAFDRHGTVPDKTCLICAMSSSLSCVVGQSNFVPEAPHSTECAYLVGEGYGLEFFDIVSGISYRGPPRPIRSL